MDRGRGGRGLRKIYTPVYKTLKIKIMYYVLWIWKQNFEIVLLLYLLLLLLPVINFSRAQLLSGLVWAKLCPATNILLCLCCRQSWPGIVMLLLLAIIPGGCCFVIKLLGFIVATAVVGFRAVVPDVLTFAVELRRKLRYTIFVYLLKIIILRIL